MNISENPKVFDDYLQKVRTDIRSGIYLTGDETFIKEAVIKAVLSRIEGPMGSMNRSVYHGKTLKEPKAVIDELLQFPAMAPERVVVIRDFEDASKMTKETISQFDIPDTSFLLIESEKPNGRTKYHKDIVKTLGLTEAKTPPQYKMGPWVDYFCNQCSIVLDYEGKSYIIDMAGQNLSMLKGEIEKLSLLFDSGSRLKKADIEKVISQSRARSIFDFVDALLKKDKNLLLTTLDELIQFGESVQSILYWIRMEYFQIAMVATGNTKAINPFAAKKIQPNIRRFRKEEIVEAMKYLYQADIHIKSGKMKDTVALYWLIGNLLRDW